VRDSRPQIVKPLTVSSPRTDEHFGCEHCWPESAEAAWAARSARRIEAELIDESHFIVTIQVCSVCSQRFVSVFTETIDWVDGEDPQYRTLLPITDLECAALKADGVSEARLNALGPDRRSLRHDFPKGGLARSYRGKGITVGRHD